MLARLCFHSQLPDTHQLSEISHLLAVIPAANTLATECPARQLLILTLARRGKSVEDLCHQPLVGHLENGALIAWCMLDQKKSRFEQLTILRRACQLLLTEEPARLDIAILGEATFRHGASEVAAYVALANGSPLPTFKQEKPPRPLEALSLWGGNPGNLAHILAEANLLARTFTVLPPNLLTPTTYRDRLHALAADMDWVVEEYDSKRLKILGAGAFLAVAGGSTQDDAAIVRLSYIPQSRRNRLALVGKGICFDTGGHNLKTAKSMVGMHEDMSGSAVALGILLAATRMRLPVRIDAWLALARNDLSPLAYRQGDVITALNGTTIEIVHTDAEGRLVLADTLTLALQETPELVIDFATLTGSMITALGTRYSGVFANLEALTTLAHESGIACGERLCAFPMDNDYEKELESEIADIKQCTLESEADHILAACFLKRFVGNTPWLHIDLASAHCKEGLGGINTAQTGFGVAWGIEFLQRWLKEQDKEITSIKSLV